MKVTELAHQLVGALAGEDLLPLAESWISKRYQQFAAQTRMAHLKKVEEVVVPRMIDVGLVSATHGSPLLTLNDAAIAEFAAISDNIVGRKLRVGAESEWYDVVGVVNEMLEINTPWLKPSVALGGYVCVSPYVWVKGARSIGTITHPRLYRKLNLISNRKLDAMAPYRLQLNAGPLSASVLGWDDEVEAQKIEIYPYSKLDELLRMYVWIHPPTLDSNAHIPDFLDPHVLIEGAMIDHMRYLMAEAAKRKEVEIATFWRNEYRAQENKWKDYMEDGTKGDQDEDMDGLLLFLEDGQPSTDADLTSAAGHLYIQGRPTG